jgi:adenylosuccinate synthase
MVIRTFPIRVAGEQAGPLKHEITWEELRREAGFPTDLTEVTTVTRKQRRVARFDPDIVLQACMVNRPTALAVHGLDYLGFENQGKHRFRDLNKKAQQFLQDLRDLTSVPIKFAFTGRSNADVISDAEAELHPVVRTEAAARASDERFVGLPDAKPTLAEARRA